MMADVAHSRRTARIRLTGPAAIALTALAALTACSDSSSSPPIGPAGGGDSYDKVITGAPVADAATVSGNAWAAKIKKQGYLRVGGTDAGPLFSIKDPATGKLTGFDA